MESTQTTQRAPDLPSCLALGLGSILMIAFMAHHPTTGSEGIGAFVEEMVAEASINRTVHGGLIFLMGLVLTGIFELGRYLGRQRLMVRAGLIAYVAAMFWLSGAALVSGFAGTALAEAYVGSPESELESLRPLFRLLWGVNQALANAGTVAWGIAVFSLSLALLKRGGLAFGLAAFGLLVGAAATAGIVSDHLDLHLHGMLAVTLGVALWSVGVSVWMFRERQRS